MTVDTPGVAADGTAASVADEPIPSAVFYWLAKAPVRCSSSHFTACHRRAGLTNLSTSPAPGNRRESSGSDTPGTTPSRAGADGLYTKLLRMVRLTSPQFSSDASAECQLRSRAGGLHQSRALPTGSRVKATSVSRMRKMSQLMG